MKSNGQQVYARLLKNLDSLRKLGSVTDKATRSILLSSLAVMRKRVFETNENVVGKGFGVYSKEYYDKIRKANNWSNPKINIELTGEMRREFILDVANGKWVIGFLRSNGKEPYSFKKSFTGKRKSKNNQLGAKGIKKVTTTAPVSGERARLLEKRYGTIFNMSKTEIALFFEAFNFEAAKRLNG